MSDSNDRVLIDFGDGVSAVDRATRAIVMATREAIDELTGMGYDRTDDISIVVAYEGLPIEVNLKGKPVYRIVVDIGDGKPNLRGVWLTKVKPNRRRRFLNWLLRK